MQPVKAYVEQSVKRQVGGFTTVVSHPSERGVTRPRRPQSDPCTAWANLTCVVPAAWGSPRWRHHRSWTPHAACPKSPSQRPSACRVRCCSLTQLQLAVCLCSCLPPCPALTQLAVPATVPSCKPARFLEPPVQPLAGRATRAATASRGGTWSGTKCPTSRWACCHCCARLPQGPAVYVMLGLFMAHLPASSHVHHLNKKAVTAACAGRRLHPRVAAAPVPVGGAAGLPARCVLRHSCIAAPAKHRSHLPGLLVGGLAQQTPLVPHQGAFLTGALPALRCCRPAVQPQVGLWQQGRAGGAQPGAAEGRHPARCGGVDLGSQ